MNILVDASTDLRAQSLENGVERIDAVLFTHPHADHIHGIDELRAFNFLQGSSIPCYGSPHTIARIRSMFDYIFTDTPGCGWKPRLTTHEVTGPFNLFGVEITPVEIEHGADRILGFRFDEAAYITDCSRIPDSSMEKLLGLKVLIIGALRQKPHPSHFTIDQALSVAGELKPRLTVLTHLGHGMDYRRDNPPLAPHATMAYDGMELDLLSF